MINEEHQHPDEAINSKLNEGVKAAGPRRPLRKPPVKPKPSSGSSKSSPPKPVQPSKPRKK